MDTLSIVKEYRQRLQNLEKERGIKIIYAAVCGSRAYGLNHVDSDCDSHFVYVYPKESYLNLSQPPEFIKMGDDINGWEIRKFLMMLRKSSFNVLEFLNSPFVIMGDATELLHLSYKCKSASKLVSSLCGCIYREENKIKKENDGYSKAKAVVSASRLFLTAALVHLNREKQEYYPPVNYDELLEECKKHNIISEERANILEEFVDMKRTYTGCQADFAKETMDYIISSSEKLLSEMKGFDDFVPPDAVYDELNGYFHACLLP